LSVFPALVVSGILVCEVTGGFASPIVVPMSCLQQKSFR
jgi:hypothetical protein